MQKGIKKSISHIMTSENEHINKLNKIVQESLDEEKLITSTLANQQAQPTTFGQRLADNVASFGGSWNFIVTFAIIILIWIILNVIFLTKSPFDPYPFILLNLVLSCVAALQAPVIMMSQNRKEEKDRVRAENDYLINLKSEIEIRNLDKKIDLLMLEELKTLMDVQQQQIDILQKLEKRLDELRK